MRFNENAFGNQVNKFRVIKGMSQKQLAQSSGIHPSYISKIENGRALSVNLDKVYRIAHALEVSVDDLLKDSLVKYNMMSEEEAHIHRILNELTACNIHELNFFFHTLTDYLNRNEVD